MKVTLTITDHPSGKCDVEARFDPPLKRSELPTSNAGRVCLAFLEFMKNSAKSIECSSIETTPEHPHGHE